MGSWLPRSPEKSFLTLCSFSMQEKKFGEDVKTGA
jgi:hypothetical protein